MGARVFAGPRLLAVPATSATRVNMELTVWDVMRVIAGTEMRVRLRTILPQLLLHARLRIVRLLLQPLSQLQDRLRIVRLLLQPLSQLLLFLRPLQPLFLRPLHFLATVHPILPL